MSYLSTFHHENKAVNNWIKFIINKLNTSKLEKAQYFIYEESPVSYIVFDLRDKIEIGDNVTLSMNTSIITHIELGQAKLKYLYETKIKKVIIEDCVYVGANCVILMGVIINQNSLIGAHSLVNKSIPENVVAYGNPAKVVKSISVI